MKGIFLQQTDIHEFESMIRSVIREEFALLSKDVENTNVISKIEEPFINKIEASQLLGVSLPTFSKLIHEACLKSYMIGKRRKFKRSELLAFVQSKK